MVNNGRQGSTGDKEPLSILLRDALSAGRLQAAAEL
jgi:hypothetical protein